MFVLKDNRKRADYLEQWSKDGGVMILGYDMFRNLAGGKLPSYLVIVLVVVFNVVLVLLLFMLLLNSSSHI